MRPKEEHIHLPILFKRQLQELEIQSGLQMEITGKIVLSETGIGLFAYTMTELSLLNIILNLMAVGLVTSLGVDLTISILSFLAALGNLFISLFLFISHDDLD